MGEEDAGGTPSLAGIGRCIIGEAQEPRHHVVVETSGLGAVDRERVSSRSKAKALGQWRAKAPRVVRPDPCNRTIFRWIQAYAGELEKRIRPHLRMSNGSWRVDETYVRVKGRWTYLDRAVDSRGQTVDFLLSARRDTVAAKRFFRKALAQPHTVNPHTVTVDKNPAYPRAVVDMKRDHELWRRARMRQCKYLNNIVEQDHRRIKRLVRPGLGFGCFRTARRTLAGFETMAMIRKGQVRNIEGRDIRHQAAFIAKLFDHAA
jgi:transposase, IS6 family